MLILQTYKKEWIILNRPIKKTLELCHSPAVNIVCTNFKTVLYRYLSLLKEQVEEIFSLVGHPTSNRAKRTWFD
jgi:hypothetical protein